MLCTVTKTFKNSRGETLSPGSTIEIPDSMLLKMTSYVQPLGQTDNHSPEKDFEQTGDPISCPFWLQVCWAVGMYQEQCTRNTDCRVYKFLKLNTK